MTEHLVLLGAFIDNTEGCEGEPLLQVKCTCGLIILESGDGWDEMVTLDEINDEARKHLRGINGPS